MCLWECHKSGMEEWHVQKLHTKLKIKWLDMVWGHTHTKFAWCEPCLIPVIVTVGHASLLVSAIKVFVIIEGTQWAGQLCHWAHAKQQPLPIVIENPYLVVYCTGTPTNELSVSDVRMKTHTTVVHIHFLVSFILLYYRNGVKKPNCQHN